MVCYWKAEITADQIQITPSLCTHIIFGYLGLNVNGEITFLNRSFLSKASLKPFSLGKFKTVFMLRSNTFHLPDSIRNLIGFKAKNPKLKVMVSIGGFQKHLLPVWSKVAGDQKLRKNFTTNVRSFIEKYRLDGVGEGFCANTLEELITFL